MTDLRELDVRIVGDLPLGIQPDKNRRRTEGETAGANPLEIERIITGDNGLVFSQPERDWHVRNIHLAGTDGPRQLIDAVLCAYGCSESKTKKNGKKAKNT
ncbi:hypothetical protein [Kordiimonas gwangyangensis]|uniref:hypothetical protein n=1 Tax=Kordiimonas gwangyangensis TaxID=288022 RepID=UPI0004725373|nr:hypothetical protein [Kordiimonas gwangyangensis]